ncbi:MAG TPA: TIGR03086 family metal-binding protein [Acidimicrobiales bacterium]|nr:TIGR03086 family metal-binding protein [Acidimicrobiales bacterium]
MSENSDKYKRAVSGMDAVVDKIGTDGWAAASPCEGWSAKHVIGHVITGFHMISFGATGQAPNFEDPLAAAGDDPAGAYAAARDTTLSALTDEYLTSTVPGPMGDMQVDQMLGMFMIGDSLIHTWDLARSAGMDVALDPQLAEEVYNNLQPVDAMIRSNNIFGPKIEPPADADIQTKLLCFVGRQP